MTEDNSSGPNQSTNLRALGLETMRSIVPGMPQTAGDDLRDGRFGEDLVEIGVINVWSALWAREGLGRRERSLVTLGILIALGAEDELKSHVRIALSNGLTREEVAEVIYHASGYAGFPRSMAARKAAREVLGE